MQLCDTRDAYPNEIGDVPFSARSNTHVIVESMMPYPIFFLDSNDRYVVIGKKILFLLSDDVV